jgi:hypothetical protein
MNCELKISACKPPLRNIHSPLIDLQLPHLYDHGLAILACITQFRNMRPPLIFTLNQSIPFHLKRSFWRSEFSPLISSKPPSPQETKHREKEREREEEKVLKKEREKLQESLQIKGEVNILRGGKHINFKNLFYMIPFSPLHHTISKTISKSLRKFSQLFLDHPLACQFRWLKLYPFSLPTSSTYSAYRGLLYHFENLFIYRLLHPNHSCPLQFSIQT